MTPANGGSGALSGTRLSAAACWTLPQGHVPSRSMLEETQDSLERLDTSWMDWEHLRILLETLWKWDKQPGLQGSCGPVQSCLEQVIQQFKGPDPGSAPPTPRMGPTLHLPSPRSYRES